MEVFLLKQNGKVKERICHQQNLKLYYNSKILKKTALK